MRIHCKGCFKVEVVLWLRNLLWLQSCMSSQIGSRELMLREKASLTGMWFIQLHNIVHVDAVRKILEVS